MRSLPPWDLGLTRLENVEILYLVVQISKKNWAASGSENKEKGKRVRAYSVKNYEVLAPETTTRNLRVCLILGWTYVVNDEKITAIGRYLSSTLGEKIKELTGHTDTESIFGWEFDHKKAPRRKRRKIEQLMIDLITFVGSGIFSLIAFWLLVSKPPLAINLLGVVELLLLLVLGVEIAIYADLGKGK